MHDVLPYGPQEGSECGQGKRGGYKWAKQTPGRTQQLRACEGTNQMLFSQWLSLLLNWSVKGSPRASSSRQGGSGNLGTSLLGGSSSYPCDPTNQPPLRQAFDWRFSPAKHPWALSNK